jgi:hypothetical protein
VASRRQRRLREQQRRAALVPARDDQIVPLVYTREQAAQLLGVSLATLDRRVVPTIATVKTEWGARLIPAAELERFLAERREEPRLRRRPKDRTGRKSSLPPDVVSRIRHERAAGNTLGEIARGLNRDGIPTGQGGRQWWPSTVSAVLNRTPDPAASHRPSAAA